MADWEESDSEIPVLSVAPSAKKKWVDEDVDEDSIKESWDMESSEDEDKEKPKVEAPVKKKVTLEQKIAMREELKKKEAEKKKNRMNQEESDEEEDELDILERKRRDAQAVIDADLENAKGIFKGVTITEVEGTPLDRINPKTKEEFDIFSNLLVDLVKKHEKQGLYINFIHGLVRELCSTLKDVDIRKISSTLTTLANEKAKALKEAQKTKKKGKTKPSLQADKDNLLETVEYVNYDDDFDDFM